MLEEEVLLGSLLTSVIQVVDPARKGVVAGGSDFVVWSDDHAADLSVQVLGKARYQVGHLDEILVPFVGSSIKEGWSHLRDPFVSSLGQINCKLPRAEAHGMKDHADETPRRLSATIPWDVCDVKEVHAFGLTGG